MKKAMPILFTIGLILFIIVMANINDLSLENKNNNLFEVKAVVLKTDDSEMVQSGIAKIGFQSLIVEIKNGKYKGKKLEAVNQLVGKLDFDNYYKVGDKIIVGILEEDGKIKGVKAIDIYRQNWQLLLFAVFVLCLILYARFTGLKALFSFMASLFIIWKILIPALLKGKEPLLVSSMVLTLLTAIIIFSVAGFTKKGIAAFVGTMCGLFVTIGITIFFGNKLALHGMTSPFAETLVFSGHLDLNMKHIFYAAIIIGASGAAMDIAMDVAASIEEIKIKKPDIQTKELIQSGFNIGRAVIGTMTTTLLLAYSGGYLTLLMLFMTKNSSFIRIINLKIVSAEIMRTLVGSIGLVLVAPITAVVAGWIFTIEFEKTFKDKKREQEDILFEKSEIMTDLDKK
ncbi:YibE/F family protein [Caminicella sporogenes]|uniref:YibE/F family protein n=1 Tax=Caminicella sporogenes TaxID=166485 RepID=UPI0025422BAA|nr:YibE/F family protein [Caminicella sporogenes]WIF95064.1 YibE/F family protein [Caminicella sporogenes]